MEIRLWYLYKVLIKEEYGTFFFFSSSVFLSQLIIWPRKQHILGNWRQRKSRDLNDRASIRRVPLVIHRPWSICYHYWFILPQLHYIWGIKYTYASTTIQWTRAGFPRSATRILLCYGLIMNFLQPETRIFVTLLWSYLCLCWGCYM